jgi:hypothetical protein
VKPGYRKKDIAPQVIQSFCYKLAQTKIQVNLFKREGQLNEIVPLVHYDTHCFDISQFRNYDRLPPAMNLIELTSSNFNLLIHFLQIQSKQFDCVVLPDVACLFNLLKLGKLRIYGLILKAELVTVYIFRPLALTYGEKKAVECIAIISTQASTSSTSTSSAGFNMCLPKLEREILFVEATAHSREIIANLQENPFITCKFKSKTAFFFYNYACHTCASEKTLLVY